MSGYFHDYYVEAQWNLARFYALTTGLVPINILATLDQAGVDLSTVYEDIE